MRYHSTEGRVHHVRCAKNLNEAMNACDQANALHESFLPTTKIGVGDTQVTIMAYPKHTAWGRRQQLHLIRGVYQDPPPRLITTNGSAVKHKRKQNTQKALRVYIGTKRVKNSSSSSAALRVTRPLQLITRTRTRTTHRASKTSARQTHPQDYRTTHPSGCTCTQCVHA